MPADNNDTDVHVRDTRRRKTVRRQPHPDQILFEIDDVPALGGPRRTKIYELIAAGVLERVEIAGCIRLTGESVRRLLRGR